MLRKFFEQACSELYPHQYKPTFITLYFSLSERSFCLFRQLWVTCIAQKEGKGAIQMMKRILLWMGTVMFSLAVISCGGGGDGDSDNGGTCEDASGTWNMTEVVNATDCGEDTYTENITYTVTQNGCNITVVPSSDSSLSFSGSVDNDQVSWTGSWPEDGGTTTATIDITINGDSASGSATWSWTDGSDSCDGTTQISGTRTSSGGATASVRFFNNLTCSGSNFTATLTACGQTLTSVSGNWSSCYDITPGNCTISLHAQTTNCGTISDSITYTIEEGSVYNFALDLSGGNPALGVNVQTGGDCSTGTPWLTSVRELEAGLEKIEAVMDTFDYIPGLQSID
jgi:hypothetical protein